MFCPYCGNSCDDSHKFCYRCGKPLPESLPQQTDAEEAVSQDAVTEDVFAAVAPEEPPESPAEETAPQELDEPEACESEDRVTEAPPPAPSDPKPQSKKGRLWPPVLFLAVMVCIGLTAFFLNGSTQLGEVSCFTVDNGTLYFDYSLYTGPDELTVPDTVDGMPVLTISDGCFRDCDRLTTIILPDSVTVIGNDAFTSCDALRGIYIPDGVLSVGSNALSECPALEAVCFPSSIMEIGEGCLDNNDALRYIFYDGTYAQWRELYDGTYPSGLQLHTNDGAYYAQP